MLKNDKEKMLLKPKNESILEEPWLTEATWERLQLKDILDSGNYQCLGVKISTT